MRFLIILIFLPFVSIAQSDHLQFLISLKNADEPSAIQRIEERGFALDFKDSIFRSWSKFVAPDTLTLSITLKDDGSGNISSFTYSTINKDIYQNIKKELKPLGYRIVDNYVEKNEVMYRDDNRNMIFLRKDKMEGITVYSFLIVRF